MIYTLLTSSDLIKAKDRGAIVNKAKEGCFVAFC